MKSQAGKKLITLEEILQNYFETSLMIDIINIVVIILDINLEKEVIVFFRLIILAKIPQVLEKL